MKKNEKLICLTRSHQVIRLKNHTLIEVGEQRVYQCPYLYCVFPKKKRCIYYFEDIHNMDMNFMIYGQLLHFILILIHLLSSNHQD